MHLSTQCQWPGVGEEKYVLLRQQRGEVGSAWGLGSARTAEFLYWRAVEVVAAQVSEMPLGESVPTVGSRGTKDLVWCILVLLLN